MNQPQLPPQESLLVTLLGLCPSKVLLVPDNALRLPPPLSQTWRKNHGLPMGRTGGGIDTDSYAMLVESRWKPNSVTEQALKSSNRNKKRPVSPAPPSAPAPPSLPQRKSSMDTEQILQLKKHFGASRSRSSSSTTTTSSSSYKPPAPLQALPEDTAVLAVTATTPSISSTTSTYRKPETPQPMPMQHQNSQRPAMVLQKTTPQHQTYTNTSMHSLPKMPQRQDSCSTVGSSQSTVSTHSGSARAYASTCASKILTMPQRQASNGSLASYGSSPQHLSQTGTPRGPLFPQDSLSTFASHESGSVFTNNSFQSSNPSSVTSPGGGGVSKSSKNATTTTTTTTTTTATKTATTIFVPTMIPEIDDSEELSSHSPQDDNDYDLLVEEESNDNTAKEIYITPASLLQSWSTNTSRTAAPKQSNLLRHTATTTTTGSSSNTVPKYNKGSLHTCSTNTTAALTSTPTICSCSCSCSCSCNSLDSSSQSVSSTAPSSSSPNHLPCLLDCKRFIRRQENTYANTAA